MVKPLPGYSASMLVIVFLCVRLVKLNDGKAFLRCFSAAVIHFFRLSSQ